MSLAADGRPAPFARPAVDDSTLATALAAGLLIAAGTHLWLAIEHGLSVFAVLAAVAGTAQAALGVCVVRGSARSVARPAMLISLVLVQLYVLNVTVGLPPMIAHTHVPGTHEVLGITLAWPSTTNAQGLLTQVAQAVTIASAALLQRAPSRRRAF